MQHVLQKFSTALIQIRAASTMTFRQLGKIAGLEQYLALFTLF